MGRITAEQIEDDLRRRYPGCDLLTADEVASYVRVSPETVHRRLDHIEVRLGTSPRRYPVAQVALNLVPERDEAGE